MPDEQEIGEPCGFGGWCKEPVAPQPPEFDWVKAVLCQRHNEILNEYRRRSFGDAVLKKSPEGKVPAQGELWV